MLHIIYSYTAIQGVREIRVILLIVGGDGSKNLYIYIYIYMG